jgi:hypothetical protein
MESLHKMPSWLRKAAAVRRPPPAKMLPTAQSAMMAPNIAATTREAVIGLS